MHNFNCFSLLKSSVVLFAGLLLTACATNSTTSMDGSKDNSNGKVPTSACVGNAYLQKYGCSTRRINQAARSGDPDAQYALGYMYYYGIGTIRDKETAKMWIDRAAKQGQPLAKKAEELIANGQHLHPHNSSSGSTAYSNTSRQHSSSRSIKEPKQNMEVLNNKTPNKSLNEVLPNYGKEPSKKGKSNAVIKSLQKKSKGTNPENVNPGKLEPITQHDPRLNPKASSSIKKMHAHRVSSSHLAKKSHDTQQQHHAQLTKSQAHTTTSPITANMHARHAMTAIEMQMMEVPKKHFTLQLMGSHNLAAMKSFIAKNNLKGKAVFYSAQLNHEKWYMLVYGNYPNVKTARIAMQNLSPTIRQLHPWIKSYRIVHDEIRLRRIVT